MARGNLINSMQVSHRFDLYIVSTVYKSDSFLAYSRISTSRTNRVIGHWLNYRDHLVLLPCKCVLLRASDNYLIFKPKSK